MLKNAYQMAIHQVRGWLVIDGVQHELAQVGIALGTVIADAPSRQGTCVRNDGWR